jgi:hypothetical protein
MKLAALSKKNPIILTQSSVNKNKTPKTTSDLTGPSLI